MVNEQKKHTQTPGEIVYKILGYLRNKPRARLALLLFPPLFMLITFFILPLVSMVFLSFQPNLSSDITFTLQNYQEIISTKVYLDIIWKTVVLTIQTTLLVTIIGYSLSYSVVRFSKYTAFILLFVIVPFWTNYIIRMYAWMNILNRGGVLDTVLVLLNITQESSSYLYTQNAVLVGFVYVWLPLATLPFYASISNLNTDLLEAAKDLGSGPIKTFFTVTLPLTKGGIVAGIVLAAIPTFGSFITPVLLGGTNVVMIGMTIEQQFNQAFNWPLGAALGMLVAAVMTIFLLAAVMLGGDLLGTGGESDGDV